MLLLWNILSGVLTTGTLMPKLYSFYKKQVSSCWFKSYFTSSNDTCGFWYHFICNHRILDCWGKICVVQIVFVQYFRIFLSYQFLSYNKISVLYFNKYFLVFVQLASYLVLRLTVLCFQKLTIVQNPNILWLLY